MYRTRARLGFQVRRAPVDPVVASLLLIRLGAVAEAVQKERPGGCWLRQILGNPSRLKDAICRPLKRSAGRYRLCMNWQHLHVRREEDLCARLKSV